MPKKAYDVQNQSKQEKKSETSEQRLWRNTRLLKAVGTGLLLGMAGMVEATSGEGSSRVTELANQHSSKLPEFSLQQAMQEERRLQEKMSNFPFHFNGPEEVASREETSRPAEDLSSSREAWGLSLKKKVKVKLPDSRSRKMASGKETPQSTMETYQGEQDKGKEPLKQEEVKSASLQARKEEVNANRKVLEHVWSSVLRRKLAADTTSFVFVHGLNGGSLKGSSEGHDCSRDWSNAMSVLASHGYKDFRTIQFYKGDSNCNANLLDSKYSKPCANYNADVGPEGTNDESLYHISCKLAQFLGQEFGQSNSNVVLVGHSMGGIIVRETMYQMQENAGQSPFPKTIGHVTDAITFTTPHSGIVPFDTLPPASYFVCNGCTQGREMEQGFSVLMWDLRTRGQNPQTSGGFTRWTVVGSECDSVLQESTSLVVGGTGVASAVDMHASHAIMYAQDNQPSSSTSCYTHFNPTEDKRTQQDAHLYYCDTSNPDKSPCGTAYNEGGNWKYTGNGPHSLLAMYDATTGNLP